jgi:tetratricopeptide (TPR) repeat protein
MTRARLVAVTLLLLFGLIVDAGCGPRYDTSGSPAARDFYAAGEEARKAGRRAEAAAAFRRAVEVDPDFVDAHVRFIETSRALAQPGSRTPEVPELTELYTQWSKRDPNRAAFKFALGFLSHDPSTSDSFYNAAIRIDPRLARAHAQLARNANLRGDWSAERQHWKAAVESDPGNAEYLMRYAQAHKWSDPPRFRELASTVVQKFPDSQAAAQALHDLATGSSNPERRTYFERLRRNYPPDKFGWSSNAMSTYYGELTTPSEAMSLAQEMAKWFPAGKTWPERVAQQQALARAAKLTAEHRFTEALDILQRMTRPSGSHGTTWVLMTAETAARAGRPEQAYTSLVESAARTPDDRLQAALIEYGTALKKTSQQVDADVWRIRDRTATPAPPFELPNTRDGTSVRLENYRGRVVLLAFWFPG